MYKPVNIEAAVRVITNRIFFYVADSKDRFAALMPTLDKLKLSTQKHIQELWRLRDLPSVESRTERMVGLKVINDRLRGAIDMHIHTYELERQKLRLYQAILSQYVQRLLKNVPADVGIRRQRDETHVVAPLVACCDRFLVKIYSYLSAIRDGGVGGGISRSQLKELDLEYDYRDAVYSLLDIEIDAIDGRHSDLPDRDDFQQAINEYRNLRADYIAARRKWRIQGLAPDVPRPLYSNLFKRVVTAYNASGHSA